MNTYSWTCPACKTPNLLVHDPEEVGQVALNCKQCGEAGMFEAKKQEITMSPGYPALTVAATCDTSFMSTDMAPPQHLLSLSISESLAEMAMPRSFDDYLDAVDENKISQEKLKQAENKYGPKRRRWFWQTGR